MYRVITFFIALFVTSACGRSSPPASSENRPKSDSSDSGWLTYEDDWIKVRYPENSDISKAENGKQDKNFPTFAAVPKTAGGGVFGAFTLQPDTVTKGMLLRDAIQSEVSTHIKPRGSILTPPREIKVGNGKCLSAIVTSPAERCEKGTGTCHTPFFLTLCDGPDGRRYTATTLLSSTRDPNTLPIQAQQEAATYERILRSLEFKKS